MWTCVSWERSAPCCSSCTVPMLRIVTYSLLFSAHIICMISSLDSCHYPITPLYIFIKSFRCLLTVKLTCSSLCDSQLTEWWPRENKVYPLTEDTFKLWIIQCRGNCSTSIHFMDITEHIQTIPKTHRWYEENHQ